MVNVVPHAGQLFGNDRLLVDVGDLIFMLVRKPVGEAETLALWREATVGETLESFGAKFTVLAADERKITRLKVELLADGEDVEV